MELSEDIVAKYSGEIDNLFFLYVHIHTQKTINIFRHRHLKEKTTFPHFHLENCQRQGSTYNHVSQEAAKV
jgi:hypothetical protein